MSANGILENIEEVLMELTSFEKKFTRDGLVEIPQILDDYLVFVARTGNTHFPWIKIKPLFRSKLEKVIREFSQKSDEIPPTPNVDPFQFDVVRDTVFEQLEFFAGIPFTVQRLCELLTAPSKHYKRTDKFMRALEKNMLVVSTIEAVHPSSSISNSSLGGVSNGVSSDSFSSTLEQREREAHLVNGAANPSLALAASDEEDEKDCLKSDETEVYSPPQSNGNSQTEEEQQQHINGSTPDLETSGPCDSGESSSSENSSPNPHASDSTTNEAVSAMQSSSESDQHHLKDELTDELLPLTDSMDIDSECSSSDNLLIETVTSGIRREEIQDEVQSTDEEERPCKKMKVDDDDVDKNDSSKDEETSPSSSKDDEIRVDNNNSTPSSADDSSRVSTSQDKQESETNDSSQCSSATNNNNNEATPSTTSTPSPVDSSPSVDDKVTAVDSNDANSEEDVQEESSSTTTTTTTSSSN